MSSYERDSNFSCRPKRRAAGSFAGIIRCSLETQNRMNVNSTFRLDAELRELIFEKIIRKPRSGWTVIGACSIGLPTDYGIIHLLDRINHSIIWIELQ